MEQDLLQTAVEAQRRYAEARRERDRAVIEALDAGITGYMVGKAMQEALGPHDAVTQNTVRNIERRRNARPRGPMRNPVL